MGTLIRIGLGLYILCEIFGLSNTLDAPKGLLQRALKRLRDARPHPWNY